MNFQNNFGTNLTSNTTAGATTSPINSIPTVDAPYYLAFDATNTNSHYEVVLVTSDTATNVLHAATTYDHTTDEEVRMIVPAGHLNAHEGLAEGQMLNGRITPSVASDDLTVALKTLAGDDPSVSDPVYVMIDGTLRTITSALSVTSTAGTNFFNAGSTELATIEIDYFVYLGYNATDGVTIGFARIPGKTNYGQFSHSTTSEKFLEVSTETNADSEDYYNVIGRFAATLSAGAGYTWTVPTFTASNLIQRPIYETRKLLVTPVYTGFSADPVGDTIAYKLIGNQLTVWMYGGNSGTSNATGFTIQSPFIPELRVAAGARVQDNGSILSTGMVFISSSNNNFEIYTTWAAGGFTTSGSKYAEFVITTTI